MKYILIIISLIAASAMGIYSQEDALRRSNSSADAAQSALYNIPEELQQKCIHFFEILKLGDIDQAFRKLLKDSPLAQQQEQIDELIRETKRANRLYGELRGFEAVSSQTVAPSLLRMRYISLHPDIAMRWIITMYKSPTRGWIVINIIMDDNAEFYFDDK